MKAKYLIRIENDELQFSNLQKETLVPVMLVWECTACGQKIEQFVDSDTPNHCYFCETA